MQRLPKVPVHRWSSLYVNSLDQVPQGWNALSLASAPVRVKPNNPSLPPPLRQFANHQALDHFLRKGHDAVMLIYKIFRAAEWAALQADGETTGAPIDVSDGYIHFSTAETVAETAAKYFAHVDGLVLLAIDAEGLDPLKWEPAREGVLFPHLYRKLRMDDVLWSRPLPLVGGIHQFPDLT